MYRRNLELPLAAAMADTPVVLLTGARQTGKSTLARLNVADTAYITFDDAAAVSAARADPAGFIRSLPYPVVLDEVQHVPELFPPIKTEVDRRRRPGAFLLTGSANIFLLPRLSETLAGRMEVLTLWPLSQGELAGVTEGFIDAVFAEPLPQLGPSAETRSSLLQRMTTGGFPEVVARRDPARRRAWIRSYTTTVLQRDVRDLANIEALTDLPRLLRLAAGRSGSLVNVAALSSDIGLPQTSLRRYLTLLQATFILVTLPSWSANVGRRVVRSPKFHLNDSALLSHLIGFEPGAIRTTQDAVGQLTENFVVMELRKQAAWSVTRPELFFFRTYEGNEVDVVLEGDDGRVVGIEVKASATVGPRDFRGLAFLRDRLGDRFVRGILLYTGEHTLPFGQRLVAMPVDALWRLGATPSG